MDRTTDNPLGSRPFFRRWGAMASPADVLCADQQIPRCSADRDEREAPQATGWWLLVTLAQRDLSAARVGR
jgi:hypothetical protein